MILFCTNTVNHKNNRELCDPFQRGKLTKDGWRVAYHIARSAKSRRLEIPATLPACLYPPGYEPPAPAPQSGDGDNHARGNQSNIQKEPQTATGEGSVANEKEEGETTTRNDGGIADTNKGTGDAMVKTIPVKGKKKHKKNKKNIVSIERGADTTGTDEALGGKSLGKKQRPKRDKKHGGEVTDGDASVVVATTTTITTTTTGKVKTNLTTERPYGGDGDDGMSSTPAVAEETRTKEAAATTTATPVVVETALTGKVVTFDDGSREFEMSDKQRSRYNKVFDKMTNGAPGKNIGGKEVCIGAEHFVRLRIQYSRGTEWEGQKLENPDLCRPVDYVRSPRSMPRRDSFSSQKGIDLNARCGTSDINRDKKRFPHCCLI